MEVYRTLYTPHKISRRYTLLMEVYRTLYSVHPPKDLEALHTSDGSVQNTVRLP